MMKHERGIPMIHLMKHLNIAMILAVLSFTCGGVHAQEVTPAGGPARENGSQTEGKKPQLRLQVVKTWPNPVIGKNSPGAETIPGGFEGGNSVKITINGKPEYHFFAHSYPELDWSQSQLDHWVSGDGVGFRHVGVLLRNYRDEQAGMNHIFTAPIPYYDEEQKRWHLFYGEFVNHTTWTPESGTMWCATSKTPGLNGINGPYDFPGSKTFVPGRYIPKEFVPVSNSVPYQVNDGRWATLICPYLWTESAKTMMPGGWPITIGFAPSPLGPFAVDEMVSLPMIEPTGFTENPMPIKVRGSRTGRPYWVAVFDFLAPEVSAFTPKNVFGFSWSEDGVHWPKEHGQIVNVDDGLPAGQRGWWRGAWAIRTPHQMIDEGEGTYTVFFTGASTDNYFAGFRAVGMVRVKLVEE